MSAQSSVRIIVPQSGLFDYITTVHLQRGDWVYIPFRSYTCLGLVWETNIVSSLAKEKLKSVQKLADLPSLSVSMCAFIEWASFYTMSPIEHVITMVIPRAIAQEKYVDLSRWYCLDKKALELPMREFSLPEVSTKAHICQSISLRTFMRWQKEDLMRLACPQWPDIKLITRYSEEQCKAATSLRAYITPLQYKSILLEGVTGSGKTEVYYSAIEQALRNKKQVLVLLPEIGLSVQWVQRFAKNFGFYPTVWHSHLSPTKRTYHWVSITTGSSLVVVGARSAIFLPYKDLGLIIVDEEHDTSFKQETGVVYHGKEVAIYKAYTENIPVILASATPSFETLHNVAEGKCEHIRLGARYGNVALPDIHLVDMSKLPKGRWISAELMSALEQVVDNGEQALLFLNRRGYAPVTLCKGCYQPASCHNCAVSLTYHNRDSVWICHHCDQRYTRFVCGCGHTEFVLCGPGVERLYEELSAAFPSVGICVITSDTIASRSSLEKAIAGIESGEYTFIIGTQVMAKGHHFKKLRLVGIIDGDLGLYGHDIRAREKAFQLLSQVSGRAGREKKRGHVYIQTHVPNHPFFSQLKSGNMYNFFLDEMSIRKKNLWPPYGQFVSITCSGLSRKSVEEYVYKLKRCIPVSDVFRVLGPAPAPLAYAKRQYHYRFLIHAPKKARVQLFIQQWLGQAVKKKSVRIHIDISPLQIV